MSSLQPYRFRLLQQMRRWHRWLGLGFLVPTLLLGVTGIVLNHKDLFFGGGAPASTGLLATTTATETLPLGIGDALAGGREVWGEVAIEKIELREDRGRLVYKIVSAHGRELLLDAFTGERKVKEGLRAAGPPGSSKDAKLDWKKMTGELHSGKIVGLSGRLLMDTAAVALVFLAASGLYLWALPRWQRHKTKLATVSKSATDP